ncbi:MAG: DUF2189 domain-containing protein [Alphaproteobacteria bacterium]
MNAASGTAAPAMAPEIRTVGLEQPWIWLAAGWRDLWRRPGLSLGYGLAVFAASWVLTAAVLLHGAYWLVLPLAAGFLQIAPLLAMGLYEISRRIENGEPVSAGNVMLVRTRAPAQIGFLGLILVLSMLAWVRIATLLFALFFGTGFPPAEQFFHDLFWTMDGLTFLMVGMAAGAVLAFSVFAISVVSLPHLLASGGDALSAVFLSIEAVRRNPGPMLLWAFLIALFTAVGMATLYAGLIVLFPLIGHATWHAYRDLAGRDSGIS